MSESHSHPEAQSPDMRPPPGGAHDFRTTGTEPETSSGADATPRSETQGLRNGTVKWYSLAKGYGFVVDDAFGDEVFVHHSQIDEAQQGPLMPSQRIRFQRQPDPRGDLAIAIERLS